MRTNDQWHGCDETNVVISARTLNEVLDALHIPAPPALGYRGLVEAEQVVFKETRSGVGYDVRGI
jgi:hypothetical protein